MDGQTWHCLVLEGGSPICAHRRRAAGKQVCQETRLSLDVAARSVSSPEGPFAHEQMERKSL